MRIILLDRNAVIFIKKWAKGTVGNNLGRYVQLRRLDRYSNLISPLLAIWEGQTGRLESEEEKLKTVNNEYKLIENFFYRAKNDSLFFQNFDCQFLSHTEQEFDKYQEIILKIQKDLFQPLSKKCALIYKEQFLSLVDSMKLSRSHPVVVLSLAVLFGNVYAHEVIKPKQSLDDPNKASYNALMDIMMLSRLSYIHAIYRDLGLAEANIQFFTFDESLQKLEAMLSPDYQTSELINEASHSTTYNVSPELFPKLNQKEFQEIVRDIKN